MDQCRLCAEFMIPTELNRVKEFDGLVIQIEICFNIKFIDDTLSNQVCKTCCGRVSSWYEYREQVLLNQKHLVPCRIDIKNENRIKTEEGLVRNEHLEPEYVADVCLNDDFNGFLSSSDDQPPENQGNVTSTLETSNTPENLKIVVKRKRRKRRLDVVNTKKVKRKYTKSKQSKTELNLQIDPDRAKIAAERSELIKRVKDEWKTYQWICAICDEELQSLDNLKIHFEKIHAESPRYYCIECKKVIPNYTNFKRHVAVHRNKFKYKCEKCNRFFARSYHYRTHLETHSTEKKFMCSLCGKYLKTALSLQTHQRGHIEPVKRDEFECDICQKKLLTKSSLYCHKKIHIGKRDFACEHCGRTFIFLYELKNHIRLMHSDVKPFCCSKCNKLFKSSALLRVHQQVHTDDRKHACDACGKKFHRKETLRRHASVHTGVLAFPCESCPKRFRTKQLLRVHTRQHTGERPYECEECNHHFVDSSNYIKHMKTKHGVTSIRKNVEYKKEDPTDPNETKLFSSNNSEYHP